MHGCGPVLRKQPCSIVDTFITVAMASTCSTKSVRLIEIDIGHVAVSASDNMQSGGFEPADYRTFYGTELRTISPDVPRLAGDM